MKDTFFRSMVWLHTWAGLLVCWVLLLIFFAGTLSYFRHEITLWNKAELHQGAIQPYQSTKVANQLAAGQAYLQSTAPDAQRWIIKLPSERQPYVSFSWQEAPKKGERRGKMTEHVANTDNEAIGDVRETRGGHFFYRLHFDLHYLPTVVARYIVGFCTMFMLIALISGIVIHKRIFKDFFSFRLHRGARSWLDFHNVSSVFALPYHLMITYTGLITLMFLYMPWVLQSQYQGDMKAFSQVLNPSRQEPVKAASSASMFPAATLINDINNHWGDAHISQVVFTYPNDKNSEISFYRQTQTDITDQDIQRIYQGASGEFLRQSPSDMSAAQTTQDVLISLHTARFSSPLLRALFFISGLLGCAMIASGTVMWAAKLRQKQQKVKPTSDKATWGLTLVEGLNFTFILGLPIATLCFFYANRLLPISMVNRSDWEVHCFFISLLCVALMAVKGRSKAYWRAGLRLASLLAIGLPIVSALTLPTNLLTHWQQGYGALVGFELMLILVGAVMWFTATRMPQGSVDINSKPASRRSAGAANLSVSNGSKSLNTEVPKC